MHRTTMNEMSESCKRRDDDDVGKYVMWERHVLREGNLWKLELGKGVGILYPEMRWHRKMCRWIDD